MSTRSLRPVTRENSALVRERGLRPAILTVVGGRIELRAKGLRSREVLDVSWCYYAAVRQRVQFERAERAKVRKTRNADRRGR